MPNLLPSISVVLGAGLLAAAPMASFAGPVAAPPPAPIPAPQSVAYPGVIELSVDATDLSRHIFTVHEVLPVAGPGPLTLLFPKWLPGEHAPTGPIAQLAGLVIRADGQKLEWTRDTVEPTAFHVTVPEGVKNLEIDLQRVAASEDKFAGTVVTPSIIAVKWSSLSLYPAGYYVSRIQVRPSVKLPAGWSFASGLDGALTQDGVTHFTATTYETLVDSPLYAGRYYRQIDLDPGSKTPVWLNVFADRPEDLEATPAEIAAHRNLVKQAYKLYGSQHYDHYDFLLALNDKMSDLGIEHHRSSENGYAPKYFTDWDGDFAGRDLLAHEYTHSWNGKFRRPNDLWTPDYNVPMRDSLLWVYEGQTQYWGYVLAARAGLLTKPQYLDMVAVDAADLDDAKGRSWRNLQDTTNGEIIGSRGLHGYANWLRTLDYYTEGALIWADADTLIREKTGGKKSLDDFAKAFFGIENGSYVPHTYGFDDVVAALNGVYAYDWAAFLRKRLDSHGVGAPLDGLIRGGYRLAYTDTPNAFVTSADAQAKTSNFAYSLGFIVNKDGDLSYVSWDSPAFRAGLVVGAQLVAVNTVPYDADVLKDAIKAAEKPGAAPIELLIKSDDRYRTVKIDYHDGLRYPKLERISSTPARLDEIIAPRK